jgi:hypothetical protein
MQRSKNTLMLLFHKLEVDNIQPTTLLSCLQTWTQPRKTDKITFTDRQPLDNNFD